jgi:hypothetical protein
MMDSSEEVSYEDDDEGEGIRRKSRFTKYDSEADIPKFCVGMIFSGRVQFKQALIKNGLTTQRHLSFPKDEKSRIRVNVHGGAALGSFLPLTRQTLIGFKLRHSMINTFVQKGRTIDLSLGQE